MELLFGQAGPSEEAFDRMRAAERKYDTEPRIGELNGTRIGATTLIEDEDLLIGFAGRLDSHDTAELPDLFREHGIDLLRYIRGHFRIAIITDQHRYLATDHVGSKHLYHTEGLETFSSHLVPILAAEGDPEIDTERMRQALINGYTLTTGPQTLVAGVRKLLPAHWYRDDGKRQQYHRLPVEDDGRDLTAATADAYPALQQAISNILDGASADPALLSSGGMDSALLAGLFSEQTSPTTLTFGWEPDHFTEGRRLAETLGIDHEELHLDYHVPTQKELYFLEEPHTLGLNFPVQALQERGHDTVVSGNLAIASFPIGISRVRMLQHAERLRPVARLACRAGLHRHVDRFDTDYRIGLEAVADEHDTVLYVARNGLSMTDDESRQLVKEETDDDRLQEVEDRWYRDEWYDTDFDHRFHLMQIRYRDMRRYSNIFNQIDHHDPFTQQHLLDDQLKVPIRVRRGRKVMHRILEQEFPELDPEREPSGYSTWMDIFWSHMAAEPDRYQELVDSFLERGWLDARKTRERVIDPTDYRYERYGGNIVFLEQWLRTFIDRDEPWSEL